MAKSRHDPSQPQSPEDQHGPGYSNDAEGWVRGSASGPPDTSNETAETKPNFDRSLPRSQMRR
jgi:hypothetical protein